VILCKFFLLFLQTYVNSSLSDLELVCLVMFYQSMTLAEASVEAMKILKQVMEERLTSTNIEVK